MTPTSLVRSIVRRVGLAADPRPPDVAAFLRSRDVSTVFDVGANTGQFGQSLRRLGYRGRIVSFEPLRDAFRQLEAKAARDPLWSAHCCALGQTRGRAVIHVSAASDFSSLLMQRHTATDHAPQAANVGTEEVAVAMLDDFLGGFERERCFLKIDTQGYERQVIAGGRRAMGLLCGVQMELPVIHLYEDVWTLSQAVDHMGALGFVICQVAPVSYHSLDPCSVIELDCTFRVRNDLD